MTHGTHRLPPKAIAGKMFGTALAVDAGATSLPGLILPGCPPPGKALRSFTAVFN
ncbi:MAG: hypothetical protein KME26_00680 [Oscillatoria princeps RMCB-10]|nr:hypothetical protein [Oscillatoria princeps RMCB-10]